MGKNKLVLTVVITAYNEVIQVKKNISSILSSLKNCNNISLTILIVAPDDETKELINDYIYQPVNIVYKKDQGIGKPNAINIAITNIPKSDWILLTDGDVYFDKNVLHNFIDYISNNHVDAFCVRPKSDDIKNNMFGYFGHLLADAADKKRKDTLLKNKFFVLSGYGIWIKYSILKKIILPKKILVDDAYISYYLELNKYKIGYDPNTVVFVKYPKNFKDWYLQKVRSLGGYLQLKKYFPNMQNSRNISSELKYISFPILYAKSIKEIYYSILLYFFRGYLWIKIVIDRIILKKSFKKTWVRVESTK